MPVQSFMKFGELVNKYFSLFFSITVKISFASSKIDTFRMARECHGWLEFAPLAPNTPTILTNDRF